MMRLIDADKLRLSYWVSPTSTVSTAGQYYFYSQAEVDNAPTIDAEPVVRCKNCKYWETVVENAEYGLCRGQGNYSLQTKAKNFYCADGEMDAEEEP